MSKFLNWASDVLEAVDQSAANLSDLERKRHKRREEQEPDGNASDSNWVAGDEFRGKQFSGNDHLDDSKWMSDSEYHQYPFSRNRSLRDLGDTVSDQEEFYNRPSIASSASASFAELSLFDFSAVKFSHSKPPPDISTAKNNFLSTKEKVEGQEWHQTEKKKEFEEMVQKIKNEEAEIEIITGEVEQLRKSAALLEAMNSQELKNLKEEALAAQRAYGTEKSAHSATMIESKMRISSLNAENSAYAKAITAIKKHTEEKSMEEARINSQILRAEKEIERLNLELEEVEKNNDLKVASDSNDEMVYDLQGERARNYYESNAQEDFEIVEQKQKQLSKLESTIEELKLQVEQSRRNMLKTSSSQREQKLEKRLILLSEKLLAKQHQLDTLVSEKSSLLLRLQRMQSAYQNLQNGIGFSDLEMKRNKILRPSSSSPFPPPPNKSNKFSPFNQSSSYSPSDAVDDPSGKLRPRHVISNDFPSAVFHGVERFMHFMDDLTLRLNLAAQRNALLRSSVVLYVLFLHLLVVIVLSVASARNAYGRAN